MSGAPFFFWIWPRRPHAQGVGVDPLFAGFPSFFVLSFFLLRFSLLSRGVFVLRTVSEYCSACVSHVGLSAKQATEPYSDNLLNRTRNPSESYSDKEIVVKTTLRLVAFLVAFSTGNPPKIDAFTTWNSTQNRTRTTPDWGPKMQGKKM